MELNRRGYFITSVSNPEFILYYCNAEVRPLHPMRSKRPRSGASAEGEEESNGVDKVVVGGEHYRLSFLDRNHMIERVGERGDYHLWFLDDVRQFSLMGVPRTDQFKSFVGGFHGTGESCGMEN